MHSFIAVIMVFKTACNSTVWTPLNINGWILFRSLPHAKSINGAFHIRLTLWCSQMKIYTCHVHHPKPGTFDGVEHLSKEGISTTRFKETLVKH